MLQQGHLQALAVSASSYSSGEHYTFYESAQPVEPWLRSQRVAMPSRLSLEHLLASSAIPFVFPATRIDSASDGGWFGDGSMRQTAPLSPAIHLGAQRLFIVGVGRQQDTRDHRPADGGYPNLAQIAGHAMSSIFLDALAVDIERLRRINRTLALLPETALADTNLRPLETLVISPSRRLDEIAARHLGDLPAPVRGLLRGVGVSGRGQQARGATLASYLLFEAPYTQELMTLGEADTDARRDEVLRFFAWDTAPGRRRVPGRAEPDILLP
jgi:NTE family protein